MQHKHNPDRPNRSRRLQERQNRIEKLAELLWDESKPAGEEGVPEDEWISALWEACNGDELLITDVCAYERRLRSDDSGPPIDLCIEFTPDQYGNFVRTTFIKRHPALRLLWDDSANDWLPEAEWTKRLSGVDRMPELTMYIARKVRAARITGRYEMLG